MSPSMDQAMMQATDLKPLYPNSMPDGMVSTLPGEQAPAPSVNDLVARYSAMPIEQIVNDEIVSMVRGRKEASRVWRDGHKAIWDKCWEHFKQVYDTTGKEAWQSKTFQPDTAKVVETIAANLHAALMSPNMPAEWQCKVKAAEDAVRAINDVVANDIDKSRMKVHFSDLLRSICITGTGIGKVGYDLAKEMVMVKERGKVSVAARALAMLTRQPAPVPVDTYTPKEMTVKDWATLEYRDLYKIYPEPHTTEIGRKHWIIEESEITNRELVDLANNPDPYYRIRNVTYDLLSSTSNKVKEDPETQIRRMALEQRSTSMHYFDPDTPHVLDEFWGPVPVWMIDPSAKDDEARKYEMANAWIWVIDGVWCVRSVLSPYRDAEPPYVKFHYIRVPGDWYGIGPAELMMGLQIEKNEVVNTGSDQTNLSLNKIIAVNKDKVSKEDWSRLKSAPGQLWLFQNIQSIKDAYQIVEFPDVGRDWYMKIQLLDQAIQETTAATKATVGVEQGAGDAGGGTFRGQLLNKQASSERFMMYARVLESCGIADIYRKYYQRIYQFKDYESVTNIIGPERGAKFEFIPPEQLEQVASLVPLGVMTMETKGVKLAQMDAYARLWMNEPWFKKWDHARRMWIEMGYSDPDSVTFSPEEMDAFNQFRKQLAAEQAQGMPGPGSPATGEPSTPGAPPGPIAGNVPGPTEGLPMPAMPARGAGAASIDGAGMPMS